MEESSELGSECPDRGRPGRLILGEWRWPQPSGIHPSCRPIFAGGFEWFSRLGKIENALRSHRVKLGALDGRMAAKACGILLRAVVS
jgi:hypothetical protein